MNLKNTISNKKIKRSSFFLYSGAGVFTLYNITGIFKSFITSKVIKEKEIKVELNPLGVSRKFNGEKNV